MKRWLIRIISVSLPFLAFLFILGSILTPDSSNKILRRIEAKGINYNCVNTQIADSLTVGAYVFGNSNRPPLLLIHGSPGDWSAWENVIANDAIRDSYFIVAIDRPGYGITSYPAQSSLNGQTAAIWPVIQKLRLSNITVVGHSYGGAVIEQLLVEDDNYFDLAVIVAGTISPVHMAPRWYNKLADNAVVNYLLPKTLKTSNLEMTGLPPSLDRLEASIPDISTPIIIIQGNDDILVPFESVDYFKGIKPEGVEYVLKDGINHFIPWTNPDMINNILIEKKDAY